MAAQLTKRRVQFAPALLIAFFATGLLLRAAPEQAVGTWAQMGAISDVRSGAAAVTLQDGRTLIAGGDVAGSPSDSVVVYDPLANSVTPVGQLLVPRVGHTATLLADGRILIVGGTTNGLISADIEVFDLASGGSTLAGLVAQPRTGHGAARLQDGSVLIVGGTTVDGVVLASAELFDPATGGTVVVPASLEQPRTGASATTLIDGRVLVAGGNNGTQDLASAELYEPWSQTFVAVPTSLSVARSGHAAMLLPHNNAVLIAGGTSAGIPVAASDLFLPAEFPDPFSYGIGQFAATGSMAAARSGAVSGPLGDDGFAFAAGGGSGDAEAYHFATIKTDKDDYAPGEFAIITGSGWEPNSEVTLLFQEDPAVHDDYVVTVTADENGDIDFRAWAPEPHDANVRFYLTVKQGDRRAQMTFTDSVSSVTITSANPSLQVAYNATNVSIPYAFSYVTGGTGVNSTTSVTYNVYLSKGSTDYRIVGPVTVIGLTNGTHYVNSTGASGGADLTVNVNFDGSGTGQPAGTTPLEMNASINQNDVYDLKVEVTKNNGSNPGSDSDTDATWVTVLPYKPSVSVAVSPASVTEDGATNLVFTFTRATDVYTGPLNGVDFSVGGTATFNTDYTQTGADAFSSSSGKVNFSNNAATASVTINPTADSDVEPDETVILTVLGTGPNVVGSPSTATGTITNDDVSTPDVSVAASPATVAEDGATNLVYTFTRTTTSGALTVNFSVGGTASFTGTADYTQTGAATFGASSGTVTIADGNATATVTVDPSADSTVEPNETVILTVIPGTGYNVGSPSGATGTITNDDTDVTVAVSPSSVDEDDAPNLVYTFTRNGVTAGALTVNFSVGGTASFTPTADYTQTGAASFGASGTVTIADGNATATVTVDPSADSTVESDETVILTVTSGTGYNVGSPSGATGTITNDDTDVTVAVSPSSVLEDGATNLVYTFTRTGVTSGSLVINFSVGGTATYSTDYGTSGATTFDASSGTATFGAGNSTVQVTVDPAVDSTVEPNETVILTVTSGTGYSVGSPSEATGTITNDDTEVTVAVAPSSVDEDSGTNLVYTFTRNGVTAGALTVNFSVGGTASFTGTADYTQSGAAPFTASSGTVTIADGETTATVTVDPVTDGIFELDETVILTVTSGTGYNIGTPSEATGTIDNDDAAPVLSIDDISASETDVGTTFTFTVSKSGLTALTASVDYATAAGMTNPAGAGAGPCVVPGTGALDYLSKNGSLSFAPGDIQKTIVITICGDDVAEPDEPFVIDLTNPSNATISGTDGSGLGTIQNDDFAPVVTNNNSTNNSTTGIDYSDPIDDVTVTATDQDTACASLSLVSTQYKVGAGAFGPGLPDSLSLTGNACDGAVPNQRTWKLSGKMMVPAGTYVIRVTVTDGTNSSYTDITIVVTKELVNIDYTGDSAATIIGGVATFQMNAALTESDSDYGTQLGTLTVRFTMKDGTTSVGTCDSSVNDPVNNDGIATTNGCTIQVTTSVALLYTVEIAIVTNDYYEGTGEGSAASIIATPGRATGGFWFYEPLGSGGTGLRVNGGMTATYQDLKKKTGAKGSANLVRRAVIDLSTLHASLPSGVKEYNFHVKSNATTQFTITCSGTPQVCKSTFTGKATVKAVDRATGVAYDVGAALGGNVSFQFDVFDGGEPGSSPGVGPDKVSIRVWTAAKTIMILDTTPSNTTYTGTEMILINGGNINIRP